MVQEIVKTLNKRRVKGIFILTSAFPFDESYNQRVINLTKFLSAKGMGVIYVAWRWTENDTIPKIGEEVLPNVFQIASDMFDGALSEMAGLLHPNRVFVVEFPHPNFFRAALFLKSINFSIVYEIIDDWEEFHKVGQAIWYNKTFEEALIVNADFLTAVSYPLIEKFSGLRKDIHLSPNGFDPDLLGRKHRHLVRTNKKREKSEIHLGYFGHLTPSWFDWDFVFAVIEAARQRDLHIHFHIIGYGEPDLKDKLIYYREAISFYGLVAPQELWKYVRHWETGFICFKEGALSAAVDPIKIYEYLYFGLPVIVKGIPHLNKIPAVKVIQNEHEFLDAVYLLHQHPPATQVWRQVNCFLKQSTWTSRFRQWMHLLQSGRWISF